jgi:hypothetical protein
MITRTAASASDRPSVPALTVIDGRPLPASGNVALAASAVVQASLGIEFTLAALNKLADPNYVANFSSFVSVSPGSAGGPLALLVQTVVLPNAGVVATLIKVTELILGPVLLIGALEIWRRRFRGRLGAAHGYEAGVAFVAALAGIAAAGLSFSIFLLTDGTLPTVMPGRAFTSAIPVELLIVPLGLSVAWLEFGRFVVLRRRWIQAVVPANR